MMCLLAKAIAIIPGLVSRENGISAVGQVSVIDSTSADHAIDNVLSTTPGSDNNKDAESGLVRIEAHRELQMPSQTDGLTRSSLRRLVFRFAGAAILFFGFQVAAYAAGTLNNTAHATGTGPGSTTVDSAQDSVTLPVTPKAPKYTINKTVANGTVTNGLNNAAVDAPGDSFVYTIAIKNTGNVTLNAPTISDPGPVFGSAAMTGTFTVPSSPTSGDTNTNNKVDVGETWSYQVTYVLTQTDINNAAAGTTPGAVSNTASATITDPQGANAPLDGVASSNPTATSTIPVTSSMTVDKTATVSIDGGTSFNPMGVGQTLNAGDIVKYAYAVTNTGNTTLINITIGEDVFNGGSGTSSIVVPGSIASLAPGATLSLTANNYTVTQADIDNLQ